jgi:release factor glutamine methyltransferase
MTPRPASERLVAVARARLVGRRARVADVGTGGGAIAIALELPDVEVWATDTSRNAILLARANVRRHGLETASSSVGATCSTRCRRRST